MNHSYVDPGLGCLGQSFVVPVSSTGQALAQPTAPAEPRECSFNHPSSRQHLKVVAVPGALDNLERPACQGPDPLDQLSSIASIGPDQPHAGKPLYQFIDDQLRSISILDIGRMHHHRQQQPHGIYNDVSLSTVDLLASVIATRPPFSVVLLAPQQLIIQCLQPDSGLLTRIGASFPITLLLPVRVCDYLVFLVGLSYAEYCHRFWTTPEVLYSF